MASYKKLEQGEADDVEAEILNSKIEELNKLLDYDYFFKSLVSTIFCININFWGKKRNLMDRCDKRLKDETRWWFYVLICPLLLIYGIFKTIKGVILTYLEWPNGKKKKIICLSLVSMLILIVAIIILIIISQAMAFQKTLMNDYIRRLGFTNFQRISGGVAQLKKNDLQEIFRELSIIDNILRTTISDPSLISTDYIDYSKEYDM